MTAQVHASHVAVIGHVGIVEFFLHGTAAENDPCLGASLRLNFLGPEDRRTGGTLSRKPLEL